MERFTLEIEMENAAFDERPITEVCRILRLLSNQLHKGNRVIEDGGRLYDINGNHVGFWRFQ